MITGIIAEYNPFHKGHEHHLDQAKRGEGLVVCIMSGDFVQRGEAAVADKWTRARAAVAMGADVVFELPLPWVLAPARRFADGAVYLMDALGCVDFLSFGSESGNITSLKNARDCLIRPQTQGTINEQMGLGLSYAAAADFALSREFPQFVGLLTGANNTLGLEYLAALAKYNSKITPLTVHRYEGGVGYRAEVLRSMLRNGDDITQYLPVKATNILTKISIICGEKLIFARLCAMRKEELAQLPEVREGLENRLYRGARQALSLDEFFSAAKTKRFTLASLKRTALCAYLGIRKEDCPKTPPYLHVLAQSEKGREILRIARKTAALPIIHKAAQVRKLDKISQELFALERRGEELWRLLFS
ncbi:MAG: nucleotidyltransferase family protein [Oscillospiraceae bacterium]|nr:nucleotidyltransferase family protein [Oscillospiraceae bacterium]